MNRRTVIKNFALVSAGVIFLPRCANDDNTSTTFKNFSLEGSQVRLVAELAAFILPTTKDFVGAKELGADKFILTMVDDCHSPADQKKFTNGLAGFDKVCRDRNDRSFVDLSAEQKTTFLRDVEAKKEIPEEALAFYHTVKRYTLQAFTTSKEFMVGARNYKMVPGPNFKGCVPA